MGSLKDEWQQLRQQRQHDVTQRRQLVQTALDATQQERLDQAQMLRADLALFRDHLAHSNVTRQKEAAAYQAELQQERSQLYVHIQQLLEEMQSQRQAQATEQARYLEDYANAIRQQTQTMLATTQVNRLAQAEQQRQDLSTYVVELQQQVQEFLRVQADERQHQAKELMQQLDEYVISLQRQSAEFLAATTAQRAEMSQQLTQDLQVFHAVLTETVASLRQDFQQENLARQGEIQALAAQTQEVLAEFHDERELSRIQQTKDLAEFVEALRTDVTTMMGGIHQNRLLAAEELSHRLKTFRSNLHSAVWGDGTSLPMPVSAPKAAPKAAVTVSKPKVAKAPMPASKPSPAAVPVATTPKVSTPMPIAPAPKATPVSMAPEPVAPEPEVVVPAAAKNGAAAPATPAPTPPLSPEQASKNRLEKQVYEYVLTTEGARLADIESAVGVNRFQAVDALRSLMQRGAISQHDRVYLAQKEVSL